MTDIVERLRMDAEPTESDMEDAANEIERLRAALSFYANRVNYVSRSGMDSPLRSDNFGDKARAALEGKSDD